MRLPEQENVYYMPAKSVTRTHHNPVHRGQQYPLRNVEREQNWNGLQAEDVSIELKQKSCQLSNGTVCEHVGVFAGGQEYLL